MLNPKLTEHYIIKNILTKNSDFVLFFEEIDEHYFSNKKLMQAFKYLRDNHKRGKKNNIELFCIEYDAEDLIANILNLPEVDYTNRELSEIIKTNYLSENVNKGLKTASSKEYSLEEKSALLKQAILDIDSVTFKSTISNSKRSVLKYQGYIQEVHQMNQDSESGIVGVPTGMSALDMQINGVKKQDYIVIGARPSMGKTAVLIRILLECIRTKNKIPVMFSLEMPAEQILARLITQFNNTLGLSSTMYANDYEIKKDDINEILEYLETEDYYIEDFIDENGESTKSRITPADIRKKLKDIQADILKKHGDKKQIGLIAVDYLQLLHPSFVRQGMSTNDIMGEISKDIKGLIREFQAPVIALSQLSRELEKRQDKRPQMSDLRDSGAIEQDADIIMFVYRPAVYLEKELKEQLKSKPQDQNLQRQLNVILTQPISDAELIIGKQRNGALGTIHVDFYKKSSMFGDVGIFDDIHLEEEAENARQNFEETSAEYIIEA